MVVLEVILFALILFIVLYIPGRFLLRLVLGATIPLGVILPLSLALGISLYLIGMYMLSWIHAPLLYYIFPLLACIKEAKNTLKEIGQQGKKNAFLSQSSIIIGIGTLCMSYLMWNSGAFDGAGNLQFFGVNGVDAIWHLSLIGNLIYNFPPTHPGLSGEPLRGYNFFYDFLIANIYKIYPFSVLDLFFRYLPVVIGVLYGLSMLALARYYKMSQKTTNIFLLLGFFAQSIGVPITQSLNIPYHSSIVQPIANIVDPSVILSVSLTYCLFPLLFGEKKVYAYLAVPILAVLPMIKIYTAVLVFAAIGIVAIIEFVRKRNLYLIAVTLLSSFLAAILYLPINFGAGSLVFAPLLLYRHYMEGGSVLPSYQWILKYQVFEADKNYIRIALLYCMSLVLFFLPSLGLRLLSIILAPTLLKKKFYSKDNIFFGICIVLAFIIPTLFIQSVAVFVTVQFIWLAYFFLLVPTSFAIAALTRKLPNAIALVCLVFLFALNVPELLRLFTIYSTNPLTIDRNLVRTVSDVNKHVPDNDSIFVVNPAWNDNDLHGESVLPLVSAISHRSVYYEPEVLEFLHLHEEVVERKRRVFHVHSLLTACQSDAEYSVKKELEGTRTDFLLTHIEYPCLNTFKNIRKISSSGPYALYKAK